MSSPIAAEVKKTGVERTALIIVGDVLAVSARGELAVALRMLVFASTHPMINDGNPLTAEQIVGILLDGLVRRDHGTTGGNRPC